MTGTSRNRIKLVAGFVLTAAFSWFFARGLDLNALGRSFAALSFWFLVPALGFLCAGFAVRVVRWWWTLRAFVSPLPLGACVWPFVIGLAVNNVLPFRAGDAVRILAFRGQLRSPSARVLGTLLIERVLDVAVLVGFFFLGLIGLPDGRFPQHFVAAVSWLTGAAVVVGVPLVVLMPWLAQAFLRFSQRRHAAAAHGRWEAIARHGGHVAETLGLLRSPSLMPGLLGLSVVAWALEGAMFATVAAAVGAAAQPPGPWFALGAGTLATMIPSTPGYLGTFDYFVAQGLAAYGAPAETAAAFALSVHAVMWTPVTAAGLLYLLLRRTPLRAVLRPRTAAQPPTRKD